MRKRSQAVKTDLDAEIEAPESKPAPIMTAGPVKEKPGGELKKELAKNERDLFDHARAALPDAPEMRDDYQRVLQMTYVENFAEECRQCDADLELGEGRSDHGRLNTALDKAEPNARRAHNLWSTLALDRKRFELDQDIFMAAMRNEATAALQAEKASGTRTKQITEADRTVTTFLLPDEY